MQSFRERVMEQSNDMLCFELETKLAKSGSGNVDQETIRQHTDLLLIEAKRLYEYGYITKHEYHLLKIACEKHDYGKINEIMQKRMHTHKAFREDKEVQHNILSALFVHREDVETDDDYLAVLYAVLFHHDNRYFSERFTTMLRPESSAQELVEEFLSQYNNMGAVRPRRKHLKGIDQFLNTLDISSASNPDLYCLTIKLKGLLHKCDYSASAHIQCEYQNDFLLEKLESSRTFDWNELQLFALNHGGENLIAIAPTGSGKTEAGLLWAGNHKCFFILPLKTAINAIYNRIKNDIIKDREGIEERVALLHSDMQSYYLNDRKQEAVAYDDDTWLLHSLRSKQMALPVTVATLDQIFDFVLKFYGFEHKLSTLSYSKIIIDEIQMYSPELLAYLIYGIKYIVSLGGKVAILTATLPPFVQDELKKIFGSEVAEKDFSKLGKTRHNVKIELNHLNSGDILHKWHELGDKESRKVLVICNCIETAQRIYKDVKEQLQQEDVEVHLFHSHFTKCDRTQKEEQIQAVGKTYDSNHNINAMHQIWIATSVVEASLDIDFDYLFTELLELFSLFQRLGRVNRKGVKDISVCNCYIYTELQDGPSRCFGKKTGFKFVDDDIYCLSKEALLTLWPGTILDEERKTELIHIFLSTNRLSHTNYIEKYHKTIEWLEELYINEKDKCPIREIENIDMIPYTVYEQHKEEIEAAERVLETAQPLDLSERIKFMEQIKQYTVSVSRYRIQENGDWEKRTKIERHIKLGRHIKIPVVHCQYDCEFGLAKIYKNDKLSFSDRCL